MLLGTEQNFKKGFDLFTKCNDLFNTGKCLLFGSGILLCLFLNYSKGTEPDVERAIKLLVEATTKLNEGDNVLAPWFLASYYANPANFNCNNPANLEESVKWMQFACDNSFDAAKECMNQYVSTIQSYLAAGTLSISKYYFRQANSK